MASESGPLLRSARLRDFNALGSVGRPVFASAPQIRATLRRQMGAEVAAMLAIPQIGESGESVDWYAPEGGLVVPWSAAAPEEREAMRIALQGAREKLAGHAETLGRQLDARPAATADDFEVYARLLPHVLRIPDENHIYSVDGKPVVTFWGFTAPGLPEADPIRDLMPAAVAAAPAGPPRVAPPVLDPVPAARPWWRWLLWLLLLLLALGLLLWLLRGCAPEVLPPALRPSEVVVPVEPDRPGGTVVVPGVEVPGVVVPGVTVPGATGVAPGTATTPEGAPAPGVTTPPDAAQPVPPEPEAQADRPPQPDAASPDAAQPPPPQPDAQSPQETPPPQPGASSKPETPLTIPPEAQKSGSTDFLNGTWTSRGGVMDERTGLPVVVQYGFENGKGTVTITRPDGTVCKGGSAARMQGGKLVITGEDAVRCNDGSAYARTDVTCAPGAGGRARCTAKPAQGPEYSVDMGR